MRWRLLRWDPALEDLFGDDPVLAAARLAYRAEELAPDQEFLIRDDGHVVAEVNAFLASRRMRSRAAGTRLKYGRALGAWLGFLDAAGASWSTASPDDVGGFKFWRMTDRENPRRVAGGSVLSDLTAVFVFYEWAGARYGVENPVERSSLSTGPRDSGYGAAPHAVRDRDVKWLDPTGYALWRDVGLIGLDRDGREVGGWRGRQGRRDAVFADGLYGTGLRLTEWASVLGLELPDADPRAGYHTCSLASACAKGGRGRRYWMPARVLADVHGYVEVERAAAVRRARREGRYAGLADTSLVLRVMGRGRVELRSADGSVASVSLDTLGPAERRKLFVQTRAGLEPAALWLNEDGMPRVPHGWQHTFDTANQRVARAGFESVRATAHMLRHSFALRWFSVGRLLYEKQVAHLTQDEARDFRAQFGDTWFLVKTLLGHADVATTMDVYLEPFRDLDVSLLMAHAHGAGMSSLMAEMFGSHPQVITDPGATAAAS